MGLGCCGSAPTLLTLFCATFSACREAISLFMLAKTLAKARVGRPTGLLARSAVAITQRTYTGGLTDKDRIFTNLYNDQSPYLEAAKKRVRACALLLAVASAWRLARRPRLLAGPSRAARRSAAGPRATR